MSRDRELAWIQANRKRKERSRPVGDVVERLVGRWATQTQDERDALMAVSEVVDDAFCDHCRLATDPRGTVVVRVDEASLVYAMRVRWHSALAKALRRPLNGVRFEYGTAGQALPGGGHK